MDNGPPVTEITPRKKANWSKKKKFSVAVLAFASTVLALIFWHPHQYTDWMIMSIATCTEAGEKTSKCFCGKRITILIEAMGHKENVPESKAVTCTESGFSAKKFCTVCNEILEEEKFIPAPGHKIVFDKGYAATKAEDGLTDGSHCGVCGEILSPQEIIYAIGSQGLEYAINSDGTCTVTGIGTCADTKIVIPRYANGHKVTSIGNSAFANCMSLNAVTIPGSITNIGDSAFKRCFALTDVKISFGVASIGDNAFAACRVLTYFTIPNSVTSIGESAFSGCLTLANITIPDSVTSIGSEAFRSCLGLTDITVSKGNPAYKDIDGVLFSYDGATLIRYPAGKEGAYTIPNGVTNINDRAFSDCAKLNNVIIPDGVTSIGSSAFLSCKQLTSVTMGNSVKIIDKLAFLTYASTEITFYGTIAEFRATKTGRNIGALIVYCTDGTISTNSAATFY